MRLINLFKQQPDSVLGYRADQLVTMAGDGRLRDGSECSVEFKEFLTLLTSEKLAALVNDTLTNKFQDSGFVLQDLVNEIGRRLGFAVTNGRYHGVANQLGHDGLWQSAQLTLVVEVKTTDAYRINLSTIANYSSQLRLRMDLNPEQFGMLLVVGRQDTGDLEAQIRGSKFAWDVRVISVESLIDLANLCTVAVDQGTVVALRRALQPMEFTRVDHIVELLSRLAFDVERATIASDENEQDPVATTAKPTTEPIRTIEIVREIVVSALEREIGKNLQRVTRSRLLEKSGSNYIVTVSKRYLRNDQHYWYAFQSGWLEHMQNPESNLCLAMLDKDFFFKLPRDLVITLPDALNKTEKDGTLYWHIGLLEMGSDTLMAMPKIGKQLSLSKYKVSL